VVVPVTTDAATAEGVSVICQRQRMWSCLEEIAACPKGLCSTVCGAGGRLQRGGAGPSSAVILERKPVFHLTSFSFSETRRRAVRCHRGTAAFSVPLSSSIKQLDDELAVITRGLARLDTPAGERGREA
jgi:hypothetical protein